ncbi:exo-alpha-sialidase [Henriciella barbarensis]|uniref:Exo-alpha-sialidase n=1 Tax=Henriciella barbarensis TaxID=86342 RepID=A0A399QQJ5_9PROT|nr:sialidase family protein [Henriciella barbarensis]RIJ20554.1 exo-alpha-sialidase [Henriciella barbarensis]
MRFGVVLGLVLLAGCGAKVPEIDSPTPVLPDAEAPTVFSRAYSLTESPDGTIRVFAKEARDYTHIYEMRKQKDGSWSEPSRLEFPTRIKLTTPSFSHADGALYYSSDADIYERGQRDANIWRVTAEGDGWGTPEPLPASINSGADQLNPAMDAQGRLYFTDNGYDSAGSHDIFEASMDEAAGDWTVSAMPDAFNTFRAEAHVAVAPDGGRIFFYSARTPKLGSVDIWTAERGPDGTWGEPRNLGEPVNTSGIDFGAGISGDGSILFFSRDGELMMISLDAALAGVGSVDGIDPSVGAAD